MLSNRQATWIWYPGDFEIWLGNIFNNRRTERGAMFPPFWKQDSHYVTVEFSTRVNLEKEEVITVKTEGKFNFMLDGKLQYPADTYLIPAGEHSLNLKVWNQATPPALFIKGDTISTNSTWLATYEDKLWIDENGVAHGSGIYVPAASWTFDDPMVPPSQYHLQTEPRRPVSATPVCSNSVTTDTSNILYDFGCETFGYLRIKSLQGTVRIYYGESREEALDKEHCETLDVLSNPTEAPSRPTDTQLQPVCPDCVAASKAFRFVYIEKEAGTTYDDVLIDYEYAPFDPTHSGTFRCSDELLNRIWDTAAYTMRLTTREFFMDGIKRDRWTWSGDAIQSYLMNYYLHFDTECVKRTIRQLRGKDPVTAHINTIMDYTFYWFNSIRDYYDYTGDVAFVREMWPRMVTLMDYCIQRTNADGMAEGKPDDWIFVDWVDFPMHKRGTLCFEQILFYKALETMAICQQLVGNGAHTDYAALADTLRQRIRKTFWSKTRHAFLHALEDGEMNAQITKFPNMFAILYELVDGQECQDIMQHVMLNPTISPITTPYMRFYELETLCMAGLHVQVLQEIRDYWGGMLREGATSFWEKYVPTETGIQHLAMYGRPYGKSLCHAWGASPVYLLGKYYLGVRPIKPGYEEYEICPALGDLKWMDGNVPTPHGLIHVYMDKTCVKVSSTEGHGTLLVDGKTYAIKPRQELIINRKS